MVRDPDDRPSVLAVNQSQLLEEIIMPNAADSLRISGL